MQAQSLGVHDPLLTALDLTSPRSQLRAGAQGQSASVPRSQPPPLLPAGAAGLPEPLPTAGTPPAAGRAWRARGSPGWERREGSPLPAPGLFFPRGQGASGPCPGTGPAGAGTGRSSARLAEG